MNDNRVSEINQDLRTKMAATIITSRCQHARFLLRQSSMQPHRTYIAVTSPVLQPYHKTSPYNPSPLRTCAPPITYPGYIQHRTISRETIAYYMSVENPPIGLAQKLFESVHSMTGLPWWVTIMVTAWGLRTAITVPLAVYTSHMTSRLERLQPEIAETMKELKAEVMMAKKQKDWTDKEAFTQFKINMKRLRKEMYIRENCHPAKTTVLAWVQIPMWVSLSLALRNMAGALPIKGADNVVSVSGLDVEGVLWIPNLLLADTTFIIPVTVGLLNLAIIEMHSLRRGTPSRLQRGITYTMRGVSILMVPIAASVPSCMAFYWACSSFFGLGQNIVLKFPSVRRGLGIPKLAQESDTPFRDLATLAKQKYRRKDKISKPPENS